MNIFSTPMLLALLAYSGTAFSENVKNIDHMEKSPSVIPEDSNFKPYANLELRHYTNTFYDRDDYLTSQEPSLQVVAQLGLGLYNGVADLYVTAGAIKMARTQQILQRRPQIELDVSPFRGENYTMTQYTIVETPFSDSSYDPEISNPARQGAIVTLGLAHIVRKKYHPSFGQIQLNAGLDIWTKMYSRKQNRDIKDNEDTRFYLVEKNQEEEDKEAEALPVNGEVKAGTTFTTHYLPNLKLTTSIHLTQEQNPQYFYDRDKDNFLYEYKKETRSHYKIRLTYAISNTLSFINDTYHFHQGFFEKRMNTDDGRRLRNIARLQLRL